MKLYAKRYTLYAIIVFCILAGCSRQASLRDINVDAGSAIITEVRSRKVLYQKNADGRFPPASTAKIMTAIVAIERMPLRKEITASSKAVNVEPTVAGLKAGVRYRLKDLLAALLINSANDAARVIAEGVAANEENFVEFMNKKARRIGMMDTYFANASGLPTGEKDGQFTTAKDLAGMMRYALKHKIILEIISQKNMKIYGSDKREIYFKTHNVTLLRNKSALWGKTGYTKEAKRTFVGIEASFKPRIIVALLQSDNLWYDITTLKDRGLEIYKKRHKTFILNLIDWVKLQRQNGLNHITQVR